MVWIRDLIEKFNNIGNDMLKQILKCYFSQKIIIYKIENIIE